MAMLVDHSTLFILLAVIFGATMCWGIGANDVANAWGPPVGAKAITIRKALLIAALFEFLGAMVAGGSVTETIRKDILDPIPFAQHPELLVYGMLSALIASSFWLLIATTRGWPISTTHAMVGAIVGFGLVSQGTAGIQWSEIGSIVASWIISPAMGAVVSYALMKAIRRTILNRDDPFASARQWAPFYAFLVGWVITLVTLWQGLEPWHLALGHGTSLGMAVAIGLVLAVVTKAMVDRVVVDDEAAAAFQYASVEKVFIPLMVLTAAAMSFAHGSNDVSNGAAPLAAVVSLVTSRGDVTQSMPMPWWILALGGGAMVVGLTTYGYVVIRTIGSRITELTPTRAYAAGLAAALVVVVASRFGIPVSTSHIAVGAVMGVGIARGISAIDLRVLGGILVSWLLTLPVAGLGTIVIYLSIKGLFSLAH